MPRRNLIAHSGLDTADHVARLPEGALPVLPATACGGDVRYGLVRFGDTLRMTPPQRIDSGLISAIEGQRLSVAGLNNSELFTDGWLNGAHLTVRGERNGAHAVIYEGTVTETICKTSFHLMMSGDTRQYSTAAVWRWTPGKRWRPSTQSYFWVATVGESGVRSPWVSVGTWTTPATPASADYATATTADNVMIDASVKINNVPAIDIEDGAIPAPTGIVVATENGGATMVVTVDLPAGTIGYIVRQSDHAYPPADRDTSYFEVSGDTSVIQPGDLAIWRKTFDFSTAKASVVPSGHWGDPLYGGFGLHDGPTWAGDKPGLVVEQIRVDGLPVLRLTNTSTAPISVGRYCFSGHLGTYYTIMVPGVDYAHTIYARANVPTVVNLSTRGLEPNPDVPHVQPVTLTSDWQHHTVTFSRVTLDTSETTQYPCGLEIPGLSSIEIGESPITGLGWATYDTRYGASGFDAPTLALAADVGVYRLHDPFIKSRPNSYDLHTLTDMAMLPRVLREIRVAGLQPWMQVEIHLSEADWLGLAEFLCAPYDPGNPAHADRVWSRKRYLQGQAAPWIDEFEEWYLEFGNENWQNGMAEFWTVLAPSSGIGRAGRYALWNDWIINVLESSPYWRPEKFGRDPATGRYARNVLGGWTVTADWNNRLTATSQRGGMLAVTAYTQGWDAGVGPVPDLDIPSSAQELAANPMVIDRIAQLTNRSFAVSHGLPVCIYEGGPSYQLKKTPEQNVIQKIAMNSVAAATAAFANQILDALLGVKFPNYFVLGHNSRYWGSHMPPAFGGATSPAWMWCCTFWARHLVGGTISRLTDIETLRHASVEIGAKQIQTTLVARVDNGGRVYIIAANMSLAGPAEIRPLTPGLAGRTCTRHYLSTPNHAPGEGWRAHNTTPDTVGDVLLVSEPYGYDPASPLTIPGGMVEVFEFA